MRQDEDYIYHYQNNARLLITGVIPFFVLVFFNFRIWRALKHRQNTLGKHFLFDLIKTFHTRCRILDCPGLWNVLIKANTFAKFDI